MTCSEIDMEGNRERSAKVPWLLVEDGKVGGGQGGGRGVRGGRDGRQAKPTM